MPLPYFEHRSKTLLLALSTWGVWGWIVYFWEPGFIQDVGLTNSYLIFYVLLVFACYWSILWLTGRWKRTLLWTLVITGFCWLKMYKLDSFLNLVLLFSFGGIWEYYWSLINRRVK